MRSLRDVAVALVLAVAPACLTEEAPEAEDIAPLLGEGAVVAHARTEGDTTFVYARLAGSDQVQELEVNTSVRPFVITPVQGTLHAPASRLGVQCDHCHDTDDMRDRP